MSKFKFFILAFFCIILTSCGFKLRGHDNTGLATKVLCYRPSNPYGVFEGRLKKTLESMGVQLVDAQQDAPLTLKVLQTSVVNSPSSIGTSNQATVYTIIFNAQVAVTNSKNLVLVGPEMVSSSITYTLNANQILTQTNQINVLTQQLQHDVIIKIIDILDSPQVHQALLAAQQTEKAKSKKHKHENKS